MASLIFILYPSLSLLILPLLLTHNLSTPFLLLLCAALSLNICLPLLLLDPPTVVCPFSLLLLLPPSIPVLLLLPGPALHSHLSPEADCEGGC